MNIAIDISPLSTGHKVRGTGFYLEHLKNALVSYFPQYQYTFFTQGENIPKDIDLLHYPYFDPFLLTLPLKKKVKTIVTIHDLTPIVFPKHFPAGIRGNLIWEMQRFLVSKADAIITDSFSSKKDIMKFIRIPDGKVHVVYLAAGEAFKKITLTQKEKGALEKKYNLPKKFILYVGDVTWNKNLPRLLEAITKLNIPLVMVGKALTEQNFDKTNPWNKDRIRINELSEHNRTIIRLGFVSNEDLLCIYNMATVFAFPSVYEGFGLPVIEAMSCGIPVVTTNEGSIPEVGGDAAYYVDGYSADSIAKGLTEVFENKNLQEELSEKGLQQAKKFSWKKTAEETISVYKNVLL